MAVPVTVTVAGGTKVLASWGNTNVKSPLDFLLEPPRCRIFDNTGVVMTNATATLMTYDSEGADTDTMHSTVTNTGRCVFTTAGTYQVTVSLAMPSAVYTVLDQTIRLNSAGSAVGGTALVSLNWMDNINRNPLAFTFMRFFSAADYIETFYTQTSGANRTSAAVSDFRSAITALWVAIT